MLMKLPTVLDFDLAITNTALNTIFSDYPVAMHFNEQSHTIEDLRCIIIENHVPNMDNRKLIELKTIIKLNTHITGLNKDKISYRIMTFKLSLSFFKLSALVY